MDKNASSISNEDEKILLVQHRVQNIREPYLVFEAGECHLLISGVLRSIEPRLKINK